MSISDFFNAVSAGNTEKLKAFHSEHPQLPLNRNIHAPTMLGPRLVRLPLVIAF